MTPEERIAVCLADVLEEPQLVETVTAQTSLLHDLSIDSLQMISFLLAVEDEFDVTMEFDSLELHHLESVRSFAHFISSQKVEI